MATGGFIEDRGSSFNVVYDLASVCRQLHEPVSYKAFSALRRRAGGSESATVADSQTAVGADMALL